MCTPLATLVRPRISSVVINATTVDKISGHVRAELDKSGEGGKKLLEACESLGGLQRCVRLGLKALNAGHILGDIACGSCGAS